MARNPGLRLAAFSLPFLLLTFCGQASVAQSAPALAQLTPGQISTAAGMYYRGGFGYSGDGGPATSAEMFAPEGVATDAAGNLYIADSGNSLIRVVNRQTIPITILGVTIQPGDIQTIAGTYSSTLLGGFGGDGGPATQSTLWAPYGLLFDKAGNLYIADADNRRVRVINMQSSPITLFGVTIGPGDINTVAGDAVNNVAVTCAASTDDVGDGCPATQAAINSPVGVSLDSAGNLYIADYGYSRIREVSAATGIISTVAGDGIAGYSGDGGNPLDAEICSPESLDVDAAGNIYISDFGNNRVRVVNTQSSAITVFGVTIQPNTIQTVAGNGNGGPGGDFEGDGVQANQTSIDEPKGLWLNAAGDLYIVDYFNYRIRLVNAATGIITTVAGDGSNIGEGASSGVNGDGGPATSAVLGDMAYVTLDSSGDIFFSEYGKEVVREISGATGVLNFPTTAPGSSASSQTVTVENIGNATLNLSNISLGGSNPAAFSETSTCNSSLAAGATCTISVGFSPSTSANLSATVSISDNSAISPQTILLSGTGASTYVAQLSISPAQLSFGNQAVGTVSAAQTITLTNTGTGPFTPGANVPSIINVIGATAGDYIETDNCGDSLLPGASCTISISFAPESAVAATAFVAFEGIAANAPLQALLSGQGTTSGGSGSQPLLQIFPGVVSTVAGDGFDAGMPGEHGGYTGLGGPAVGAELQGPTGVANDASGNVYFSSGNNNVVQLVDMESTAVTVAGVSVQPGDLQTLVGDAYGAGLGTGGYTGDGGPALSAELNQPVNPVLDKSGNIYFTDLDNNVVRVVNTQSSPIVINGVTIAPNDIQTVAGLSSGGSICAQATDPVGDGCPATSAYLAQPEQIAFDPAGNLYIADACSMVVRAVNMGASPTTIAGVTIQPGQIQIVAGTLSSNPKSCSTESFGGDGGPALSATFDAPTGLAIDSAGNLYITDTGSFRVRAVNTQSKAITIFGVAIQPGDVETVVANGTEGYSGDFGPATSAEISIVEDLALDPAGNLYLADSFNNVVRIVFASTGTIRTVAGNGYGAIQYSNGKATSYSGGYTGDGGAATSAEFYAPNTVSIDPFGNLYIADLFNKVVRQVSATAAAFTFPDTQVGSTSASEIYTLSNISAQTISLTGLKITANYTQVPSGLTDCTATTSLAPGEICQLALAFAPTTSGLLPGEAQITDNAGVQSILLSGEGTPKTEVALQSITVTPSGPSLAAGATQQFTATGTYSDGSTQTITASVTWSSSNSGVATIGIASGLATAVVGGTTQITATAGSVSSAAVTLTVTSSSPTLKSIAVTPANPSITLGGTQQFTATGTYSDGSTQTITTTVTWTSSTTSVASIGALTGLATGFTAGTTTVQAAMSGTTGSTTLSVNNPVPTISSVSPGNSPAGNAFTLTINGTDFLSSSVVSFNGKTETTTFVNASQLTASISAADAGSSGTVNVTVTNPTPGGGSTPAASFTLDDFSLSAPSTPVMLTPGQPTVVALTITPTTDGFNDPVQLSVTGLPSGATAQFLAGATITPGSSATQVTLTITAPTSSALSVPVRPGHSSGNRTMLYAALLAGAALFLRRKDGRRAVQSTRLFCCILLGCLSIALNGCGGGFPGSSSSPGGNSTPVTYTLTVSGMSGTLQHTAQFTIDVQ